jgi:hypothetical protein
MRLSYKPDRFVTMVYLYNYHNSGYYLSPIFYLKSRRFGDWSLSPSSGGTSSDGPNRKSDSLSPYLLAETSSFYLVYLSKFYLKTETESSLRNVVFSNKRQDDE